MTSIARITTILSLVITLAATPSRARAGDAKPAPVRTITADGTLGEAQLADLAAKRLATQASAASPPVTPIPGSILAARHTPAPLPAVHIRFLPQVSEALGPIPRESWIRLALGKDPDVTVSIPAAGARMREVPR